MLIGNPYELTSDDVLFNVYAQRSQLEEGQLPSEREKFFSRGNPVFIPRH